MIKSLEKFFQFFIFFPHRFAAVSLKTERQNGGFEDRPRDRANLFAIVNGEIGHRRATPLRRKGKEEEEEERKRNGAGHFPSRSFASLV